MPVFLNKISIFRHASYLMKKLLYSCICILMVVSCKKGEDTTGEISILATTTQIADFEVAIYGYDLNKPLIDTVLVSSKVFNYSYKGQVGQKIILDVVPIINVSSNIDASVTFKGNKLVPYSQFLSSGSAHLEYAVKN